MAEARRPAKSSPPTTFRERVYWLVRQIPIGRVMTYGQIALLLGQPRAARAVGGALHALSDGDDVPWHRVINHAGRVSTRCLEHSEHLQRLLLADEGIAVDDPGGVDLQRYRWWPDPAQLAALELSPELRFEIDRHLPD